MLVYACDTESLQDPSKPKGVDATSSLEDKHDGLDTTGLHVNVLNNNPINTGTCVSVSSGKLFFTSYKC